MSLLAGPTRTRRTPVAKGSRVPACPTLAEAADAFFMIFRTSLTTSCEVGPAGLFMLRAPIKLFSCLLGLDISLAMR